MRPTTTRAYTAPADAREAWTAVAQLSLANMLAPRTTGRPRELRRAGRRRLQRLRPEDAVPITGAVPDPSRDPPGRRRAKPPS